RTGDATENNFALPKRAVLVLADVRHGGNLSIVFEYRHALAGKADDARAVFGNIRYSACVNEIVLRSSRGNEALTIPGFRMSFLTSAATRSLTVKRHFTSSRCDVQAQHRHQPKRCRDDVKRTSLALQHAKRDMQHEQGGVNQAKREHRYPGVAAVVEQWQELWIQPAQRADAKNDVQKQERRCAKRAHEHDFVSDVREKHLGQHSEDCEIRRYAADQHGVVEFLLPIPLN